MPDIYDTIHGLLKQGEDVVFARVISDKGSAPRGTRVASTEGIPPGGPRAASRSACRAGAVPNGLSFGRI